MPNTQNSEKDIGPDKRPGQSYKLNLGFLLLKQNRGLLLDVVVFTANLFLMRMLLKRFLVIAGAASDGDFLAGVAMFLFVLGLFILPPLGATLKRWHFHERLLAEGKKANGDAVAFGCLFNPIFYLCLNFVIFAAINAFLMQYFFGNNEPGAGIFVSSILFGMVWCIVNTWLVYRYFSPPKHPPASAFMRAPRSEIIGDVSIFINMLLFQLIWNMLSLEDLPRPDGIVDILGRLFFLCFLALLIYFPPRIFYLADDIHKKRTWIMMLIANSPIIIRVLIGVSPDSVW
jgi:hypothetical protein